MGKIEETGTRLSVTMGSPVFNGTVAVFDKTTGRATIQVTNLFFKGTKDYAISDIAATRLVKLRSSSFGQIVLKDGKRINLPSAGLDDAIRGMPAIEAFLGIPRA